MTVSYTIIVSLIAFGFAWNVTQSPLLAGVVGAAVALAYSYLPLPRTNGSLGAETERYWGFTK